MDKALTDEQHEAILLTIANQNDVTSEDIKQILFSYQTLSDVQVQLNSQATKRKCLKLGCNNVRLPLTVLCSDHFRQKMDNERTSSYG